MIKILSFIGRALLVSVASYGQVITYDLTYTTTSSSTLVGAITVDTSNPGASTGASVFPVPIWMQSVDFSYTSGGTTTTYSRSDLTSVTWQPKLGPISWNADLVPQFNDINLFFGSELDGVGPFTLQHSSGDEFVMASASPVPEPRTYALVFGMGLAGFALYRKCAGRLERLNPAL